MILVPLYKVVLGVQFDALLVAKVASCTAEQWVPIVKTFFFTCGNVVTVERCCRNMYMNQKDAQNSCEFCGYSHTYGTGIYQMRCTAYKVAPEDGLI